jgi:DNA-directed RNA polymerase delta subunit
VSYGYEDDIFHDSVNYYKNFEINDPYFEQYTKKYEYEKISDEEVRILKEISSLLKSNKTEFRIVISPLYDKIKLDENRIKLLIQIFGENNIYDFSGVNEITEEKTNYYESSHYRHKVANKIMETVYTKN